MIPTSFLLSSFSALGQAKMIPTLRPGVCKQIPSVGFLEPQRKKLQLSGAFNRSAACDPRGRGLLKSQVFASRTLRPKKHTPAIRQSKDLSSYTVSGLKRPQVSEFWNPQTFEEI